MEGRLGELIRKFEKGRLTDEEKGELVALVKNLQQLGLGLKRDSGLVDRIRKLTNHSASRATRVGELLGLERVLRVYLSYAHYFATHSHREAILATLDRIESLGLDLAPGRSGEFLLKSVADLGAAINLMGPGPDLKEGDKRRLYYTLSQLRRALRLIRLERMGVRVEIPEWEIKVPKKVERELKGIEFEVEE